MTRQPHTYRGFQRGVNLLAAAIRPTLGPLPRITAVEPVGPRPHLPELLDSGGLIARRFLQLRERDADVGAMFLRQVLWRLHERVGDGTATAAVLFQSLYGQGIRHVVAGGDAMRLRRALEHGMALVLDALQAQARPLASQADIAQLALGLCHDPPLADALADILETVGQHGPVDIRTGRSQGIERQYIVGSWYRSRPLSEWQLAGALARRIEVITPAIIVSDLDLDDPDDLLPLLRLAEREQIGSLLLLARQASSASLGVLSAAGQRATPCRVPAVKAPDALTGQDAMLDDLALLTGARVLRRAAGDSLRRIRAGDLGHARRAWSDDEYIGIIGGRGPAAAVRTHLSRLRDAHGRAEQADVRRQLGERIGKLQGGSAVLWVGGLGPADIAERRERASRTLTAVRATIGRGVVPGGGAALLACAVPLRRRAAQATDADERAAWQMLARALETPARAIIRNAGYDPAPPLHAIAQAGAGYGFDVRSGQVVDMRAAGIIDPVGVTHAVLHSAIASAALALTVDVLVHQRMPELSFEP